MACLALTILSQAATLRMPHTPAPATAQDLLATPIPPTTPGLLKELLMGIWFAPLYTGETACSPGPDSLPALHCLPWLLLAQSW